MIAQNDCSCINCYIIAALFWRCITTEHTRHDSIFPLPLHLCSKIEYCWEQNTNFGNSLWCLQVMQRLGFSCLLDVTWFTEAWWSFVMIFEIWFLKDGWQYLYYIQCYMQFILFVLKILYWFHFFQKFCLLLETKFE